MGDRQDSNLRPRIPISLDRRPERLMRGRVDGEADSRSNQLSYGPRLGVVIVVQRIRGTGLEPALRGSQPLVPSRLHHPLRSMHVSRDGTARTCGPSLPKRVLFLLSYIPCVIAWPQETPCASSTAGLIRTGDPLVRSQVLSSAELRRCTLAIDSDGGIRTHTEWLLRPRPLPLGYVAVHRLRSHEASGARTRNLPLDRRMLSPIEL